MLPYNSRLRGNDEKNLSAERKNAEAPRLSIVVLPFANIGGDPEQDYFVDGVTESLTTDLSRISGAFVIARNTAFTYKGKPVDVKQIGRELNVRYVLEGSVQRGGNRLRVNVQLIDAESGSHLWAERFDKPVADLFDMQDEIVARLARQLDAELIAAEARRAERAPNPNSTDFTFRGAAILNSAWNKEELLQAMPLFDRAIQLDGSNVEALVGLASVHYRLAASFLVDDNRPHIVACEASATRALALAPNHARAHDVLGWVNLISDRLKQAAAESERAIALDRNLVGAYSTLAMIKIASGRAEEAEEYVVQGLRLSPKDTIAHQWCMMAGAAYLYLGRYPEAALWLRRSIEMHRAWPLSHIYLAAALAQNGEIDEAREEAVKGLALAPNFTVGRFRAQAYTSNPTYLAQRERIIDGMRKAGVPE